MSGVEAVGWLASANGTVLYTKEGAEGWGSTPVALYSQVTVDTLRAQLEAAEADWREKFDARTIDWTEAGNARDRWMRRAQDAEARAEAAEAECARLKSSIGAIHFHAKLKGNHAIWMECEEAVPALAEITRTKEETK